MKLNYVCTVCKKNNKVYHHCKVKIFKNYSDFNVIKVGPGSRLEGLDANWIRIRQNDADLTGSGSATQLVQYITGHSECDC
jgi:hypothetical protein